MNLSEAKVHFIGIGGIGMSGIAEVLANMGCRVSGSDLGVNAQTERLKSMGIEISHKHSAESVPTQCDVVVFSSAVKAENPEIIEAHRRHIPTIQRAEMLAEIMRLKRGIAVGGTHGKTTTTSMVAAILLEASLDPTIVVGGRLDLIKSTAALGKGEWFVAEADESDGSFLKLSPEILIITNIDNDHLDHHGTFEKLNSSFMDFAQKIPFYGRGIFCVDDPFVAKLSKKFNKRQITYGFTEAANLRAIELQTITSDNKDGLRPLAQQYKVSLDNKPIGVIRLRLPGNHNALNSLAALAVGLELKLPFEIIARGLERFAGVDRRLQIKGFVKGALVIDDYGHHPTEVLATLSALRQQNPKKRIICLFQPHRFTRTRDCWEQFKLAFVNADLVGIADIYSAGEKPIEGIDSNSLVEAIAKPNVEYWGSISEAEKTLMSKIKSEDIVLTLGAGDIYKVSNSLVSKK